jgi:hypothetical protein
LESLIYLSPPSSNYPHVWLVYIFLLTLPITVVCNERGFSKLKLVKNRLRQRSVFWYLSHMTSPINWIYLRSYYISQNWRTKPLVSDTKNRDCVNYHSADYGNILFWCVCVQIWVFVKIIHEISLFFITFSSL